MHSISDFQSYKFLANAKFDDKFSRNHNDLISLHVNPPFQSC